MIYTDTLNFDHISKRMGMLEFRELLLQLPYAAIVQLHASLIDRIDEIGDWRTADSGKTAEWDRKAGSAQRAIGRKVKVAAARIAAVEGFTLAQLASQCGGLMGLKDDPAVQARFLVGLVGRLVDPATLSEDEKIAVEICRDAATKGA